MSLIPSGEARWAFVRLLPVLGVLVAVAAIRHPGSLNTTDAGPLIAAAHRILAGRYAVLGTTTATEFLWHGPGLPVLLAPLVAIGAPLAALRMTSAVLMFAAVLLLYRLLRLGQPRRGALTGAYCLGFYGPAYYVVGTVSKDALALVCSIAALDAIARYLRYGRRRHALIAGLLLGALVMTRLEYGWVVSAALVLALGWWLVARLRRVAGESSRVPRRFALVCAVGMLACVPWLAYTYSLTGHPFYWGNSGGISLYWMSSPSPDQLGQWHAWHTVFSDPSLASYRPLFRYIGSLSPLQQDSTYTHLAIVQASEHPAKYALNLVANVGRMFFGFPFSFTLPAVLVAGLILFNGGLLAGVAFAGTSLARARASLPRETVPFLLVGLLGFAVHVMPSAEPRMLLPIVPVEIWLIAQAAHRWQPALGRVGAEVPGALRLPRPLTLAGVSGRPRAVRRLSQELAEPSGETRRTIDRLSARAPRPD
jgi:4-amino-4-deoxy-L-arabinose transferase-like glycosyltransferase